MKESRRVFDDHFVKKAPITVVAPIVATAPELSVSGEQPARSELVDEREPDPSDYYVPMRAIDCPSTHGGSVAANSTDLIYRMPHLF